MKATRAAFACLAALGLAAAAAAAADDEASAASWKKQANDTRATVLAVAHQLEETGDKGNSDARGLIDDAGRWLARGDESLAEADALLEKGDHRGASHAYNMAWQYYVKAATAGLNAQSILGGP